MSALPKLTVLKLDNTLGALLVGLIVSTALFGLTTLQTYLFFVNYPKDKAAYKWLVGILWMLDFIHTVFVSHAAYYFLVQQYGNPAALLDGEWSIISEVAVTVLVTVLVQSFFAQRIYRLSNGNWMITGLIVVLTAVHAALGFTSTIRLFQIKRFALLHEVLGLLSATLIAMAVNDILITAAICWYLQRAQSPAGTHDAISLLILYTIETGSLTSVFVTTTAICVLTMPQNWIFIGLEICVSKLYANSLLTILNSRRSVRNKFGDAMPPTSNRASRFPRRAMSPAVSRTQMRDQDLESGDVEGSVITSIGSQASYPSTDVQIYSDSQQKTTSHGEHPPRTPAT